MLLKNTIRTLGVLVGILVSPWAIADTCGNDHKEPGADYTLTWSSANLGADFGVTGFSHFDADQDNLEEFLFATANGSGGDTGFVVVEYNTAINDYAVLCQSLNYASEIEHILPFSNSTIAYGTLIALSNGSIYVVDHGAGANEVAISLSGSVNDILTDDVDNDGEVEIAVLTDSQIRIYNSDTFSLKQIIPQGGSSFTSGQFTDNVGIEIAINTGFVFQLDNAALSTLWDYSQVTFSNRFLSSGDIDNDGLDEIVGADDLYRIVAYNADTEGVLWEKVSNFVDVGVLQTLDVDGDSVPEVVYSDLYDDKVHALVGSTGGALWGVTNPGAGINNILIADVDTDTNLELVWGTALNGLNSLYVIDLQTLATEWQLPSLTAPYRVAFSDVDGNDVLDRVYTSGQKHVTAMQGGTNDVVWQTSILNVSNDLNDIESADIDGDHQQEVVVATDYSNHGRVYILDAATGSSEGVVDLEANAPIYAVSVADVDHNLDMEIVAGGGKIDASGYAGTFAYQIDGTTHAWDRTFPSMGKEWTDLVIMEAIDFDGDNNVETIAVLDQTYIINPETNGLSVIDGDYASLAVAADPQTTAPVLYLGGIDGGLYKLETDGSASQIATLCASTINALESINSLTFAFTCDDRLGTYNLITGKVTWQTAVGAFSNLGANDQLKFAKVSDKNTLFVGGSRALYFVAENTINTVPVAGNASYLEHFGETISATLAAKDPGSSKLTFGIYQSPSKGHVTIEDASTGAFSYVPDSNFVGTDEFVFYASNGTNISNLATVTIAFTNATPTVASVTQDIHWNSKFMGRFTGTDADGDRLQYAIVDQPSVGALVLLGEYTGNYSYINTNPNLEQVSFSYRAFDGAEWSAPETVTFNLINTVPVANAVSFSGGYLTGVSTPINGGKDNDGDSLVYELVTPPGIGDASISDGGFLTYNALGADGYQTTLTYRVFDGKAWSEPADVVISIVGVESGRSEQPTTLSDESNLQDTNSYNEGGSGAFSPWMLLFACLMVPLVRNGRRSRA